MIIDCISDSNKHYPKGSLWQDGSSYKANDGTYDFYMMFDKWKFIGRFDSFVNIAFDEGALKDDH